MDPKYSVIKGLSWTLGMNLTADADEMLHLSSLFAKVPVTGLKNHLITTDTPYPSTINKWIWPRNVIIIVPDSLESLSYIIEQDTLPSAKYWFRPARQKIVPTWLKNCWLGHKASTQTWFYCSSPIFLSRNFTKELQENYHEMVHGHFPIWFMVIFPYGLWSFSHMVNGHFPIWFMVIFP